MTRLRGITLIEIVISLAVSSIVLMAAYSFFNVSVQSWDFSSSRMDAAQSSTYIIDTLEKLLKENYFNCMEWYVGTEKYDIETIKTQLALPRKWRSAFAFRNGIALPFDAEDQIDEHSKYYGLYNDLISHEVRLWNSRFENGNRVETNSLLGQNVSEMTLTFFDKNFTTKEVPSLSVTWYTSREICWVGIKVKSVVGKESSESSRMISLWR
ncbi:MAG: prepilin-type N-terminal cleavage/methylation domain-containing protein [Candidatus Wallbacteria bacterium]|nr:prepilin-type N-terminal cleavage/methylation domain-containing protein [Candidatus Wallbacteria bacterium]